MTEGPTDAKARSYALALVPLGAFVVLGALLHPRAVPPEEVPLPQADGRVLGHVRAVDHARAVESREPLPADVRALGTALLEFNARQAHDEPEARVAEARALVDRALSPALDAAGPGLDALVTLRAIELSSFLSEVRAFEASGVESEELARVAGSFVRRMRTAGWCDGHTLAMGEGPLAVAFKLTWNATVDLETRSELTPTLDEMRVLYAFYVRHPHAPEAVRARFDAARKAAPNDEARRALDAGEALAAESWRLEKIRKIAALDPQYPGPFALGVAHFRHGDFAASAESFRDWLRDHPDGPWTIRARNHLRAALDEAR